MNPRPLILISNDDGYLAEGLRLLVETVSPLADVIVLAPDVQQSGKSSSISTADARLILKKRYERPGVQIYSVNGTPVDCVKLAFYTVCKDRKPDLVLSGINKGSNSAVNIVYSGTMGAAREGCVNGIPSVGISQCFAPDTEIDYAPGLPLVAGLVKQLLNKELVLPEFVYLNVNFPPGRLDGPIRWAEEAHCKWINEFRQVGVDENGDQVFALEGDFICLNPQTPGTDEYEMAQHHGVCVPVRLLTTDFDFLKAKKQTL
ncbi:MAG: 5'/3'-nucleotidase SurE [Paludibacteraceae bacterium]|nr:5'/3'-nucleotidase SurE [Paludibacteraceae bacterium]